MKENKLGKLNTPGTYYKELSFLREGGNGVQLHAELRTFVRSRLVICLCYIVTACSIFSLYLDEVMCSFEKIEG